MYDQSTSEDPVTLTLNTGHTGWPVDAKSHQQVTKRSGRDVFCGHIAWILATNHQQQKYIVISWEHFDSPNVSILGSPQKCPATWARCWEKSRWLGAQEHTTYQNRPEHTVPGLDIFSCFSYVLVSDPFKLFNVLLAPQFWMDRARKDRTIFIYFGNFSTSICRSWHVGMDQQYQPYSWLIYY